MDTNQAKPLKEMLAKMPVERRRCLDSKNGGIVKRENDLPRSNRGPSGVYGADLIGGQVCSGTLGGPKERLQ
jgi:hypothetical protein